MKNEIMRTIIGVPRYMDTEDGYEEAAKDFEVAGLSGEARNYCVERPMGNRVGQFSRPRS